MRTLIPQTRLYPFLFLLILILVLAVTAPIMAAPTAANPSPFPERKHEVLHPIMYLPALAREGPFLPSPTETPTPTPTFTPSPIPSPTATPSPTPTPTPLLYGEEQCANWSISEDTYVDSKAPGFHGNENKLVVSTSATAFLYANLLDIPTGSLITDASLVVDVAGAWGTPGTLVLHQVLRPWKENWISQRAYPAFASTPLSQATYKGPGTYHLDMSALVQDWVNAQWPNVGVALTRDGEDAPGSWQMYSGEALPERRPYIHVCYKPLLTGGSGFTPPSREPFQFVGYVDGLASSVATWRNTLIVGELGALEIYDLSSPTRPRLQTRVTLGDALVTDIWATQGFIYAVQNNRLLILSWGNGTPKLLGEAEAGLSIRQIVVTPDGRYAFVNAFGGIIGFDVSVPERPRRILFYPTSFWVAGMAATRDYLYIWGNYEDTATRFEVLRLTEEGNITAVVRLIIANTSSGASNMGDGGLVLMGTRAYYGARPVVIDISSPEYPRVVNREGWIGTTVDITGDGQHLFTVTMDGGVNAVEITEQGLPRKQYTFVLDRDMHSHFRSTNYRIAQRGNYLYAAMGEHGLIILRTP